MQNDAVARGAHVLRLDRKFRWLGGRHVAVVLKVAFEGLVGMSGRHWGD